MRVSTLVRSFLTDPIRANGPRGRKNTPAHRRSHSHLTFFQNRSWCPQPSGTVPLSSMSSKLMQFCSGSAPAGSSRASRAVCECTDSGKYFAIHHRMGKRLESMLYIRPTAPCESGDRLGRWMSDREFARPCANITQHRHEMSGKRDNCEVRQVEAAKGRTRTGGYQVLGSRAITDRCGCHMLTWRLDRIIIISEQLQIVEIYRQ